MLSAMAGAMLAKMMKTLWDELGKDPRAVSVDEVVRMKLALVEALDKIEDDVRAQQRSDWEELKVR